MAMATSGTMPVMTIFWLKVREGWRENDRLEITGKDGGPIEMTSVERKARIKKLEKFMKLTKDE